MGEKYFPINDSSTQSLVIPSDTDRLKLEAWQRYKQHLQALPYEMYLLSEYWLGRDRSTYEDCYQRGWEVHHIDYSFVKNEIGREQGLITLCDRCHANRHAIA